MQPCVCKREFREGVHYAIMKFIVCCACGLHYSFSEHAHMACGERERESSVCFCILYVKLLKVSRGMSDRTDRKRKLDLGGSDVKTKVRYG